MDYIAKEDPAWFVKGFNYLTNKINNLNDDKLAETKSEVAE